MTVWLDGRLVPLHEATMPVLTNAVFRGTTVFDVIAVVGADSQPAAVGLRFHLERFMGSMRAMYMTPAVDVDELVAAVHDVVHANPGCGLVRAVAYWDSGPGAVPDDRTPRILVAAEPAGPPPRTSISLQSAVAKIDATVLPAQIKVAGMYTAGIRAQISAQQAGFDGIVNRSHDGDLVEGLSSSVAIVTGGRFVAPPLSAVLDSITRQLVFDAAIDAGFEVDVRSVPWSDLTVAEACIMSSTTAPFVAVERIDDIVYAVDHPTLIAVRSVVDAVLANRHPLSTRWLTPLSR